MSIYFSTNIPEMRSLIQFNRVSLELANITRRLETGQRINSGKDDPAGLILREGMRADIKGLQAAQKSTAEANQLLSTAESGLASISQMLTGDINDNTNNGLLGIILDGNLSAGQKKQMVNDMLARIDGIVHSTNYGGKQLLNGSMGYQTTGLNPFQLQNVVISRANLTDTQMPVTVAVEEVAAKGQLTMSVTGANIASVNNDTIVHLTGVSGENETFTLDGRNVSGLSSGLNALVAAINEKSDTTGVTARRDGTNDIIFETQNAGSNQTFSVFAETILRSDGTTLAAYSTVDVDNNTTNTSSGKDAIVTVNGLQAEAKGWDIQFYGNDLTLSATLSDKMTQGTTSDFNITGGGMLFQLGKDVIPSLQLSMGLPSMGTASLGLNELRNLDWDQTVSTSKAAALVNEAVGKVADQRAAIGSVQKNVLDYNSKSLDSQLERLFESEALISNVDAAQESSRFSRAELLAQSAMNAILYSRSFSQFVTNMLW